MPGAWERHEKVLCAILCVDTVPTHWAASFRRLLIPGPDPVFIGGMPFDHARNHACEIFLQSDCDWLFFLDSDVCPPAHAVYKLLSHRAPLMNGVYCRRSGNNHGVPVLMRNYQWVTTLPDADEPPVIEVDFVGAGCMLIRRDLIEKCLTVPHRPGKPWFDWRVDLLGHVPEGHAVSEDFAFCIKAKELGVPVLIDTSVRCKHLGFAEFLYNSVHPVGTTSV